MSQADATKFLAVNPVNPVLEEQSFGPHLEKSNSGLLSLSNGFPQMVLDRSAYCEIFEDFQGNRVVPLSGALDADNGPLILKDTSAAGTPTEACAADADDGQFNFIFAANDEAEVLTLYMGDQQTVDPKHGPIAVFRLKTAAQLLATDSLVFGLGAAQNDDPDAVTSNAWFKLTGANLNILCEADDGTTDSDDKDTGYDDVAGTFYEYAVDATSYDDVKFYLRTSLTGDWTDVTPSGTTFKLNSTTQLQLFLQFQKSGGAGQSSLLIDYVRLMWKRSA